MARVWGRICALAVRSGLKGAAAAGAGFSSGRRVEGVGNASLACWTVAAGGTTRPGRLIQTRGHEKSLGIKLFTVGWVGWAGVRALLDRGKEKEMG